MRGNGRLQRHELWCDRHDTGFHKLVPPDGRFLSQHLPEPPVPADGLRYRDGVTSEPALYGTLGGTIRTTAGFVGVARKEFRPMTNPKDHLLSWLRDAHAAEEQAVTMLSNTASRIENYPELKVRFEQHHAETKRHSERIKQCLERHGSGPSMIKEAGTKMIGLGQALSGIFTSDEVMKAVLACYTFEQMEIASYRILVAAARHLGDTETQRVCEEILQEELAMAKWLEEHLEEITEKFFALEASGSATAKH
jgi:ferritin-like metal-binding protein YciE